ncbi:MAG: O-antigen ligase family protein [Flavitalea sp.]
MPLILFFHKSRSFYSFSLEISIFLYATLLYFVIGQEDVKMFVVSNMVFIICCLYFRFFIGNSLLRFRFSVAVFYALLAVSTVVMYLNHLYPDQIDTLRAKLIGDPVNQSPSGITSAIFSFGYQLAALTVFIFLYTFMKKGAVPIFIVFALSLAAIYYGMQRSVLVDFFACLGIFLFIYFGFRKFMLVAAIAAVLIFGLMPLVINNNSQRDNIFSKNKQNLEEGEQRTDLVTENLKIYANYPLGLIFYNKKWSDVIRGNPAYPEGITSHNAYLMFFTYLGPVLGIVFLIGLYYRVGSIFKYALTLIKGLKDPLLIAMCFSLLAACINSLFHNAWLLETANGVIVFIYVGVIHYYKVFTPSLNPIPNKPEQIKSTDQHVHHENSVLAPVYRPERH